MKKKVKKNPAKVIKKSGIMPLGDRVLVKPFTEAEASGESKNKHFGIILPNEEGREKSSQGKVVAVGPGKYIEGKLVPVGVKKGDVVVFSKYSYDEVKHDGEELYLIKEDNVLAVIN